MIAAKTEEKIVEDAIHSVLDQADVDFEPIFVDEGSTDQTRAIVQATQHPRLRVCQNPKSGKCSAFNFGVSLAEERFVTIFAGDDIMPAGSLAARFHAVSSESDSSPVVGLCKLQMMSNDPREDGHVVPKAPGVGILSGVYLFNRRAL